MTMDDRVRTIVAGISDPGGDPAQPDPVLRDAVALGRRLGAAVHLVHAYLPPTAGLGLAGGTMDFTGVAAVTPGLTGEEMRGLGSAIEARLRTAAAAAGAGEGVTCRALAGPAYAVITEVADESGADLVLVGASHRGRVERFFLGTTAGRTLRQSRVPVLVLRTALPERDPSILIATDLSDLSLAASAAGMDLLRRLFAGSTPRFRCLTVAGLGRGDLPPEEDDPAGARAELARFVARLPADGATIESVVRLGAPVDEIAAEGSESEADLLLLGTHGHTGLSHLFLGSVAETAVRDAPCSALVIPALALRESVDAS